MRLTKLFLLTTGLVLTLVSVMLVRSVLQEWHTVSAAQRGLQAMEITYQAMKVAEMISFERALSIATLGDSDTPDPARRGRLITARDASDTAFAAALIMLTQSPRMDHVAAAFQLTKAQEQLQQARREVAGVTALPRAQRTSGTGRITRVPIDQMSTAIDTTLEAVTILSADAELVYPELTQPLVGARLAAELREYADRLGSQFTAPIGAQKPLGAADQRDITMIIGRLEQLRKLIEVQARANVAEPRVAASIAEMKSRYFAIGLPLIGVLTDAGTDERDYGLDLARFVAIYVPEMDSIIKLRDIMFDVARKGATTAYARAQHDLMINAAIGLLILLIEIAVFLFIRRRVLKPLLANSRTVVAIAEGKLDIALPVSTRTDEIGDMQSAVAMLRKTSEEKQRLEAERDRLIEQLQHTSSIDFLTNLLNRRAFVERITQQLALAKRQEWSVALIIFDIDHFKGVNDRFGHATGDSALVHIASIARREFRAADTLARFGGEEFIALLIDCSRDDAIAFAERLRLAIANAMFFADNDATYQITASFGVVGTQAAEIRDTDAFFQLADKALYRAKAQGRNQVAAG